MGLSPPLQEPERIRKPQEANRTNVTMSGQLTLGPDQQIKTLAEPL